MLLLKRIDLKHVRHKVKCSNNLKYLFYETIKTNITASRVHEHD